MTVFGEYAQFYDALYREKDYAAECDFLERVFSRYASEPVCHILDLGCGTGSHALHLAARGYQVTGVDRSTEMLAQARAKPTEYATGGAARFLHGDIREVDLGESVDAVIAMFAVVGYMTSNDDLASVFRVARQHLRPGGLFCFDAWYGPAVLAEHPADRLKTVSLEGERILRFAHPELDVLRHVVHVHYRILRLHDDRAAEEVEEVHSVRFVFAQEMVHYLAGAGFDVAKLCRFPELDGDIRERDWNLAVIARAR